ncbi:MAG: DUF429 domain-containing protein [Candidatus Nanohaloarchaea archaeon]
MFFVGVDLAWSDSNPTGVAVIKGDEDSGTLLDVETVETDREIIDFVEEKVGDEDAIVAVDAPLKVPNETGRRPAEEVVGELFSRYDAGAHPANRKRLSKWSGRVRGEDLVEQFEARGFQHDPYIDEQDSCRRMVEVYPHPSTVALFDLDRILRYKKKSGRDYETVWEEFRRFQENLRELEKPSLEAPEVVEKEVEGLKGGALKKFEDRFLGGVSS